MGRSRAAAARCDQDGKGAEHRRARSVCGTGLTPSHIQATTLRHLRLSLNAFLEDTALIVRTMDAFRTSREDAVGTTDTDGPLEQGSVGRAG